MDKRQASFKKNFPWALWISISLLCIFFVIMIKAMVHQTTSDREEYSRIMAYANPGLAHKPNLAPYTATQQRQGIRKDYFYTKGSERMQLRLVSDKAILMMQQNLEGSSMVEKMHNVKCHMQEELFYLLPDGREALKQIDGQLIFRTAKSGQSALLSTAEASAAIPMQQICYFEAKEASYYYKTDTFSAAHVQLMRYVTQGHLLPQTSEIPEAAMRGSAGSIEVSLGNGEMNFNAADFKAQFKVVRRNL